MPIDPEIKKISNDNDIEVIKSILNGNKNDFIKIQKKYKKILTSVVRRMIRNEMDAEDVVQESFIKAYNALDTYNHQFNFSSWIVRIASNNAIDFLRKKKVETISISRGGDSTDEEEYTLDFPDTEVLPDLRLINNEQMKILQAGIDKLPENFKTIIRLRFQAELDYTEISKEMGIPLGTVKATLFRSRKLLQVILKNYNIFNEKS